MVRLNRRDFLGAAAAVIVAGPAAAVAAPEASPVPCFTATNVTKITRYYPLMVVGEGGRELMHVDADGNTVVRAPLSEIFQVLKFALVPLGQVVCVDSISGFSNCVPKGAGEASNEEFVMYYRDERVFSVSKTGAWTFYRWPGPDWQLTEPQQFSVELPVFPSGA